VKRAQQRRPVANGQSEETQPSQETWQAGDAGEYREPAPATALRGRGAAENPAGRFERLSIDWDADPDGRRDGLPSRPRTVYLRDPTRSVLSRNDSPDIPFSVSLNPYRGCEHGCSYCYARPTHEYLGFSAGLDFETKILVKENAPELLRRELSARSWQPQVVALAGVTDVYQPIERRARITRGCIEVFAEFRNPIGIVTKSALVLRDLDLLSSLAEVGAVAVYISITTLDEDLHRVMEPRAATPRRRLATVAALAEAGIPVGVMLAPVIPGLTDHEIPKIVESAANAGARSLRSTVLRLPYGLKDLFSAWLERHFPDRRQKVLNRVMSMRGDRLNDPRYHHRMQGDGFYADQIRALVALSRRRHGLSDEGVPLSIAAFRRPAEPQLSLFPSA
jgi:DNA repair photolyase